MIESMAMPMMFVCYRSLSPADMPPYRSPSDRPGLSKTHIFWLLLALQRFLVSKSYNVAMDTRDRYIIKLRTRVPGGQLECEGRLSLSTSTPDRRLQSCSFKAFLVLTHL